MMHVLDEIWAEEGGYSLRITKVDVGVKFEVIDITASVNGFPGEIIAGVTLADFRVQRMVKALLHENQKNHSEQGDK